MGGRRPERPGALWTPAGSAVVAPACVCPRQPAVVRGRSTRAPGETVEPLRRCAGAAPSSAARAGRPAGSVPGARPARGRAADVDRHRRVPLPAPRRGEGAARGPLAGAGGYGGGARRLAAEARALRVPHRPDERSARRGEPAARPPHPSADRAPLLRGGVAVPPAEEEPRKRIERFALSGGMAMYLVELSRRDSLRAAVCGSVLRSRGPLFNDPREHPRGGIPAAWHPTSPRSRSWR